MILLNGHSLEPARKVPLEAMSLQLNERDSSAQIQPADMTGIAIGKWMQDDTAPGKGIVWRVKSIRQACATKTPTVTLEHAVSTLKDRILFGEVTCKTITGNSKATTCTAKQAAQYILSKQSDWTLGTFEYTDSNPYKFDGDTLFDALAAVSDSLDECWWEYDFTSYPFRISFVKKSEDVGTVLRCGRNLTAVTKTVDRTGMFTRFYPIGKDDLHIDGNYVEKNTALYGVISKVETDQSITTKAELKRWANERLARHAEPVVTVDVDGLDLSRATGETMDRIVLGRKCRMPLTDFGGEILETITQLNYNDKVHQPEVFRATLANKRTDATRIIADALKRSGRGGRSAARQQKEDHAWFEDTNDHVAMCAKGIIGVDAQGNANWERLSRLDVSEGGISSEVKGVQNGLTIAESRITQTENSISLEVSNRKKGEKEMTSRIEQNESEIKLTVKKGNIISSINQSAEQITIKASKINLSGYVKASELETMKATIKNLMTGYTRADYVRTRQFKIEGNYFSLNESTIRLRSITIDGTTHHYLGVD